MEAASQDTNIPPQVIIQDPHYSGILKTLTGDWKIGRSVATIQSAPMIQQDTIFLHYVCTVR